MILIILIYLCIGLLINILTIDCIVDASYNFDSHITFKSTILMIMSVLVWPVTLIKTIKLIHDYKEDDEDDDET